MEPTITRTLIILCLFLALPAVAQQESLMHQPIMLDNVNEEVEFVETPAKFPGGEEELAKFINEHVTYPKEAIEMNIQGKVYCRFVVEIDGSLSNIEIVRSPDALLSDEAIRIVQLMPKWKPGEVGGKKLRTRVMQPINFVLETDESDK